MAYVNVSENPIKVQVRVILALILRETRVTFGTAQLGYLWAILSPALGTGIMVLIFSFATTRPFIGESFALFFATGIIPFELNRKLSGSLMNVFKANKGLMSYPLLQPIDFVIARFLLIVMTYALVMLCFFGGLILLSIAHPPVNPEVAILAVFVTSVLGLGVGLINSVLFGLWSTWQQIEGIIARPLFFISGIFFTPDVFPKYIQYYLSWNPLIHVTEWFREGYYGTYSSVLLDKQYLLIFTGICIILGFGGERLYRKRIH